jgi:hypothetical protein
MPMIAGIANLRGGNFRFRDDRVMTEPTGGGPVPKSPTSSPLRKLEEIGAGEGIRTPDPNLGKVVLYP